jgi:putative chitinase
MIDWPATQKLLGLTADGIPGPNTYRALFGYMGAPVGTSVTLGIAANVHFPAYGISESKARLADALAQTANETGLYTRFEENLNYSAEALTRTWPNRFPPAKAQQYAHKPEMIAAVAYGDRMGNRSPDDGYLFRGRGMLQLTGRANYEAANKRLGIGLDTNPELAAVPALSLLIACDFYEASGALVALDAGDTDKARRITNGGAIGLDNVNRLRARALTVLV